MTSPTLEDVFRAEYPRVVASLARRFGDLDLAEDGAGEAVLVAVESWSQTGVPPNPGGWLTTTATRKVIDRLRRESHREAKHRAATRLVGADRPSELADPAELVAAEEVSAMEIDDDQLRLIFLCNHPALAPENRVALTLRLVGGLSVAEIARALLTSEAAIGQRITRAKTKIRTAHIALRLPGADEMAPRLDSVLSVLYLIFNEGYLASAGSQATRVDLSDEAIRLTRVLAGFLPEEPEASGLLALMVLADARRSARFADGDLVTLVDQDRSAWDRERISEGHAMVHACIARNRPGRFQLQAAIAAVHTSAASVEATDWDQIVTLYDHLARIDPSPVVQLNRAVAVAELDGPSVGLALIEASPLPSYAAWWVARAEMLRRLERITEARDSYAEAISLSGNDAEQRHLIRRRDQLGG